MLYPNTVFLVISYPNAKHIAQKRKKENDWPLTQSACYELFPGFLSLYIQTIPAGYLFLFKDMAQMPEIHLSTHEALFFSEVTKSLLSWHLIKAKNIVFLKKDSGTKGRYGKQRREFEFESQ